MGRGKRIRELNELLNNGESIASVLNRFDNTGEAFNGYLTGVVYNAYVILSSAYVNTVHKKPLLYRDDYSIYGKQDLIGSANLTTFTKLYQVCRDNQINPVYYLSAIFGYDADFSLQRDRNLVIPKPSELLGLFDVVKRQKDYDSKSVVAIKNTPHETIRFRDNILIRQLNYYFQEALSIPEFTQFQDVYDQDWGESLGEFSLSTKYAPEQFETQKLYNIVHGSSKWLQKVRDLQLFHDANSIDTDMSIIFQSAIVSQLNGIEYPYRGMALMQAIQDPFLTPIINKATLDNLIGDKLDNLSIDLIYQTFKGRTAIERQRVRQKELDNSEKRTYVRSMWWRYVLAGTAFQVGCDIAEFLSISDESLAVSVDTYLDTLPPELRILTKYHTIDLDKLEGFNVTK